jgi:uncharacterized phage infection (PIP) family protein YhgE
MDNTTDSSIFDLAIDEESRSHLFETCKWAKLLSIMGIILSALMVLGGLIFSIVGSTLTSSMGMGAFGSFIGLIYLALGALYFYPSWKLMRFSGNMPAALRKNDQGLVTEAFGNLKSCFKFWGIMTLVIIGLYIVAMLGVTIFSSRY